jgi:N-acetylmuramic acid 6-phosphate etherase
MDRESFLRVSDQFRLGELTTEKPHPLTIGLAEAARSDLAGAIEAFNRVDLEAMDALEDRLEPLPELVAAMQRTLQVGGRIFLCGCGATGRLALSIEVLAREAWLPETSREQVIGFMAGGDAALIRSLEAFEDYPQYGARQLGENGFGENDLLLAITEGGETPFVIGACRAAAEIAREAPWFLFCNPETELVETVERSREVLESPRIRCFCLAVGPMALAGSTRLQAATVQMLVAGAALAEALGHGAAADTIARFRARLSGDHPALLAPFIEAEAEVLRGESLILYLTDRYGITVLTDTTERSPTFSVPPFESRDQPGTDSSPWYLSLPGAADTAAAWAELLHRPPRTLEWPELEGTGSLSYLLGHDISARAGDWRRERLPGRNQYPFLVHGPEPVLEFAGLSHSLGLSREPLLVRHLMLKCRLNLHSTLLMGRLGHFESNLMTAVRPSNHKLVDRAARLRQHRHRQLTGKEFGYLEAVAAVFEDLETK